MTEKRTFTAEQLYDASRIRIKEGNIVTDLWIGGSCQRYPGYSFAAKVFDYGSEFGIENGRISKLHVWNRHGKEIMHYDRGWSGCIPPRTREHLAILQEIMRGFPEIETTQERKAREQSEKRLNAALGAGGLHHMDNQFNRESGITAQRHPDTSHPNPMGFFERGSKLER